MVVAHNLIALNSDRQFNIVTKNKAKSTEKLSSGYKINRAADDAAGLAISEKMRRQIRGLSQASENSQDGISMVQTAEGGLNEVHDMLQRMNELSVKAANGPLTDTDRSYVDAEVQRLKSEINRLAGSTTFNEIQLFPDDGSSVRSVTNCDVSLNLKDGTWVVSDPFTAYTGTVGAKTGSTTALANMIATKMIPDAASKILSTFPALNSSKSDVNISVQLATIDKPGGTLAYAQFSFNGVDAVPGSFIMKVDTQDFSDANALKPGDPSYDLLQATIYHEMTHSVMQNTMANSMVNELPTWFKEGVAQLAGGGFSTGWNNGLVDIVKGIVDENDDSADADIKAYLQSDTVTGRPYGHGYLASAYMGWLAAGGNDPVTAADIAKGMNYILGLMKNSGDSFDNAILTATGKTRYQIIDDINNGAPDAVTMVRQLTKLSDTGAGSILAGVGLSGGGQLDGSIPFGTTTAAEAATTIFLQVGADAGQHIDVDLFSIGTRSLGIDDMNVRTENNANDAIDLIKGALEYVSTIRSYYGAIQNRLEHTINNLNNVVENTTAAESQIRDTDMATEMVRYSNDNILAQAGQAMLAQANQYNQGVLSLLQ